MERQRILDTLAAARADGRTHLLENEGLAVLESAGIEVPRHKLFLGRDHATQTLDPRAFPGDIVVVKVVAPGLLHKSDVGGVKVVRNEREAILATVGELERAFRSRSRATYLVEEFVSHGEALGSELLLSARWTPEFGPVLSLGAGGVTTELLARGFRPGTELVHFCCDDRFDDPEQLRRALGKLALAPLLIDGYRGAPPLTTVEELGKLLTRFAALVKELMPAQLRELEVNPFARSGKRWVALDVLAALGSGEAQVQVPKRPVEKLEKLLQPRSIAIAGVSEKQRNPGRIILGNILHEGFDPERVQIIKLGAEWIDGCRCYPDLAALPQRVDLLILSLAAAQVAQVVTEAIEKQKAESIIVIPGGLEEKSGSDGLVAKMRAALEKARASESGGPLINGGNCLGVRSRPGHYDTLFIPEHKLPRSGAMPRPLAMLSQSGAFAISCLNRLGGMNPRYLVTLGNQSDLTLGDYLEHLAEDRELRVFAVYAEGFRPGDGAKFLRAARRITRSGRTVVLYRAGRSPAGAAASASHTASMAGDYSVTRTLAESAGVVVAESLADFEDLVRLFTLLDDKPPRGWRLGALSNAGFECVAAADNLGRFELAPLTGTTRSRLSKLLAGAGIDQLVDVHNPLDVTPMCDDAAFQDAAQAILDDDGVDAAVIACVPLTAALNTLEVGVGHDEDVHGAGAVGPLLAHLLHESRKPAVAVVAGGPLYDALAEVLSSNGVPVFRSVDRAVRLLETFAAHTIPERLPR